MNPSTKTKTLAVLAGLSLVTISANAAIITGVSLKDSDGSEPNGQMTASDAIDGTGLSSLSFTATHSTTWNQHWFSGTATGAFITVDLGDSYVLDTIHIWNENENNAGYLRGLKDASIYVSPDGDTANLIKLNTSGSSVANGANGTGDFLFSIGPQDSGYAGFGLDLSVITNASLLANVRLVKIETITNHGTSSGSGLAEVQFGGVAVPEPTTTALLGIGGLALILRRRK
ncbi:MAG: PEP-CTERM sorting domain-containing protein [Rubritalea sp.]